MIVRYEIECWNDIDDRQETEKGFAAGSKNESIGTVIDRIYEYYGRENVISLKFYECEDILIDEELKDIIEN